MKTIKKITWLVIILLMAGSVQSFAQRGRNYNNQGRRYYNNASWSCNIPNLTDDQQQKIETLRLSHLRERTNYQNQMNELRARKITLMRSNNTNLGELNSLIDQITTLQNKKMQLAAKHRTDVRALLTDDQKVYFDSKPMYRNRAYGRNGKCRMRGGQQGRRGGRNW